MKKIIYLIAGLVIGALLMGTAIWNTMPKLMLLNMESRYDFQTTVEKLITGVYDNGWEVINEIDIQERLHLEGYDDMLRVQVIEICKAERSYTILQDDANKHVAGIMPDRIAVYETNEGKVMVSKMNIGLLSRMFGGLIQQVMSGAALEQKKILAEVIK
jgi:uncharacterized protein (DUF302 family)